MSSSSLVMCSPLVICMTYLLMKNRLVSKPYNSSSKLLCSRPRVRIRILAMLVQCIVVEVSIELHLAIRLAACWLAKWQMCVCTWSSILCRCAKMDSNDGCCCGGGGASAASWGYWNCSSCYTCHGMQYFSMNDLLMGGWMSLVGMTNTPKNL